VDAIDPRRRLPPRVAGRLRDAARDRHDGPHCCAVALRGGRRMTCLVEQGELFGPAEIGPRYRRTEGYAATPGSGPPQETCRSCEFYCRVIRGRHAYRKCWLEIDRWRWSETTEIRAGAPACKHWRRPPMSRAEDTGGDMILAV